MKQTRHLRLRYKKFCIDLIDPTMILFHEDDIKSTLGDFVFSSLFHAVVLLFGVVEGCCKMSCNSVRYSFSLLEAAVVTARSNNVLA